jgi:thiol:disulfide interchange protein
MRTRYSTTITACLLLLLGACSGGDETPAAPETAKEVSVAGYDDTADPAADVQAAVAQAAEGGQRILLEVGGEWCSWCHLLEKFVHADEEVAAALDRDFLIVKVNYSDENKNEGFLGQYAEINGYPHLFVLESDGSFLHSQETDVLEAGKGYDREKFLAFLAEWAPVREG